MEATLVENVAVPPSREQLLYLLHEAAEIEHNLMCCYLYAAFSLKRADPHWSAAQSEAVERWRGVINGVAREEMTHLCLVANLMNALGAQGHFNRPMFPIESGPYPADFVIRLQPFSRATIEHFEFLERPVTAQLRDGEGFVPLRNYSRMSSPDRLSPGARDYSTVGELYVVLRAGLDAFVRAHGEAALFLGDARRQVDEALVPLVGVDAVVDLAGAHRALDTIVTQGEGAGDEHHESHFSRFMRVGRELTELTDRDPDFEPSWPAAINPVMNRPPTPQGKVHIDHPVISRWLDIGNAIYTTSLRCLLQGFGSTERRTKSTWLSASFALMRAMVPVGEGLAARPAHADGQLPNAGFTFTSLRTLAWLPESSAVDFVMARIGELEARARELPVEPAAGEKPETWARVIDTLRQQRERLAALAHAAPAPSLGGGPPAGSVPTSAAPPAAAATPAPAAVSAAPAQAAAAALSTGGVSTLAAGGAAHSAAGQAPGGAEQRKFEVAKGRDVTIRFEAKRCIHARHCVLEAPTVFKANTPGEWIYPDTMRAEALVEVAHKCPSGAITYERHGGEPEGPPPVNLLRVRENGPYAVHAQLRIAGVADGYRATLCRCGRSQNKPWCDGAHNAAGFAASGEPATGEFAALAVRDGALDISPLHNGPLLVHGNLEICTGTGRTAMKVGLPNADETRLCRCGQSRRKPFCDGSHVEAGFVADGE